MPFFVKCVGWSILNIVMIVAGIILGPMLAPRVNPHNDWGVTGMLYAFCGALAGSSSVIVLLLWRNEQRTPAQNGKGPGSDIDL
jgi:hypothetical protein